MTGVLAPREKARRYATDLATRAGRPVLWGRTPGQRWGWKVDLTHPTPDYLVCLALPVDLQKAAKRPTWAFQVRSVVMRLDEAGLKEEADWLLTRTGFTREHLEALPVKADRVPHTAPEAVHFIEEE